MLLLFQHSFRCLGSGRFLRDGPAPRQPRVEANVEAGVEHVDVAAVRTHEREPEGCLRGVPPPWALASRCRSRSEQPRENDRRREGLLPRCATTRRRVCASRGEGSLWRAVGHPASASRSPVAARPPIASASRPNAAACTRSSSAGLTAACGASLCPFPPSARRRSRRRSHEFARARPCLINEPLHE